ncbi:MAG: ribonucleoside triphosphate reductase, partial [Poseidonibacter sp.]
LYKARYFDVMKSFIVYRHLHKIQREQVLQLETDTTYINSSQTIQEYINGSDWRIKANSNTGYSHAGLINNSAGKVIANYWLDKVYSKEEGYAHRNADYHIHDLDCLSGYCAGWSLRVLLDEGFNGVRGRVESTAPKHFREALGQMANFLGILQSEWAGAQAFSSFDTYLAPYVFKDKLSYSEIKKAVRSFIYNLNVPARWGQSPFTNITIDWTVPQDLKDQIPTSNQEHLLKDLDDEELLNLIKQKGYTSFEQLTYKDFQKQMNQINKAYYEIMTEGDKTGQPFTFPIPTVNITEDFDWYGENTDVLFENTAKIGSSYFQNFIGSQYIKDENGKLVPNDKAYKPGHVRSMCCRLQLDLRELLKRGGGLFGSAEMTGSIGVVTINMARLGFLYKNDINALLKRLEELMLLAKSTLEKKRVFVQDMYDRGLFPYTQRYLPGFNNHFSTIGVNGMNEMIKNYFDEKTDLSSELGITFSNDILDFMRAKMIEFQEETGNLYNLEATPAEGTTYRFAKEDKKRYEDIVQAGQKENIYYTNSSQLPVDFTDDPFEALALQDELQCKYTGGTVLHLYMSEKLSSIDACRKFVKNTITNFKLPYITVTPLFSVCEIHGYLHGEHEFCPKCDEEILGKENTNEQTRSA